MRRGASNPSGHGFSKGTHRDVGAPIIRFTFDMFKRIPHIIRNIIVVTEGSMFKKAGGTPRYWKVN
jgi:hypothetical protein